MSRTERDGGPPFGVAAPPFGDAPAEPGWTGRSEVESDRDMSDIVRDSVEAE